MRRLVGELVEGPGPLPGSGCFADVAGTAGAVGAAGSVAAVAAVAAAAAAAAAAAGGSSWQANMCTALEGAYRLSSVRE